MKGHGTIFPSEMENDRIYGGRRTHQDPPLERENKIGKIFHTGIGSFIFDR